MAAELIAREFVKKKHEKLDEKMYISVEQFFEACVDPNGSSFTLVEKGKKIYIVKDTPTFKKKLTELEIHNNIEKEKKIKAEKWRKREHRCNTCVYEMIYEQECFDTFATKDPILYVRDCLSLDQGAIDFFQRNCGLTINKEQIPPVTNCPYWKKDVDKRDSEEIEKSGSDPSRENST